MKRYADGRVTEAGRVLRKLLDDAGKSVPDFCDENGLRPKRVSVQKLLNGKLHKRVSVDLALALVAAARTIGGKLRVEQFRSNTAKAA